MALGTLQTVKCRRVVGFFLDGILLCNSGAVAAFMNYEKPIFVVEFLTLGSFYSSQGFEYEVRLHSGHVEAATFTVTNSGLGNPPSGKLAARKC